MYSTSIVHLHQKS